jgi:colicin import membrane protein
MAIPVTTELARRDRLWPAVIVSAVAHASLMVWALVRTPPPEIDLQQKPIVAKLVRLGEKRPEQWLPRKEEAPPAPAPAEKAPAPAPGPPARPVPTVAIAKPEPKAPPRPAPARTPTPSAVRGTGNPLASVLSRVREQKATEQRWGSPDGDPAGDSDTGGEGDRYLALVLREIQSNYRVPATISERDRVALKSTVVLYVDPDGRISRWNFVARSGNPAFDDALERTLRQTRLPPPPDGMKDLYRRTGLQVIFQI